MKKIDKLIEKFFERVKSQEVELYNEFSFQHELGIFLREKLSEYKIQFERNISYFGLEKINFAKKEIDISIFNDLEKNMFWNLNIQEMVKFQKLCIVFVKILRF